MKKQTYTPDVKHEFIIMDCDWKANLDKKEQRLMFDHAKKVDGIFEELEVYTADSRVFYSGPEGIEAWIAKHAKKKSFSTCANELFLDYCVAGEQPNDWAEVGNWYFDGKEVYVLAGKNWNKKKKKYDDELSIMTYKQWVKYADKLNEGLF